MMQWIVSSSVLILVVIALRYVLRGKLSLRMQYALWLLVLVRLLVPVSFGASDLSVMNAVPERAPTVQQGTYKQDIIGKRNDAPANGGTVGIPAQSMSEAAPPNLVQNVTTATVTAPTVEKTDWARIAKTVWLAGAAALGLVFLAVNLRFGKKLRRSRERVEETDACLPVYESGETDTPCLFGVAKPSIYVTPDTRTEAETLRYALAHEQTHYRHGDNLWAVLRGVCLALHWYNPLVWWAAELSRRDAELACDEATIRRIGESERAAYGRTLIRMTCEKRPALLVTATMMTDSGKGLKERISLLVKKPKTAAYTAVAVLLIAGLSVACTFTGGRENAELAEPFGKHYVEEATVACAPGYMNAPIGGELEVVADRDLDDVRTLLLKRMDNEEEQLYETVAEVTLTKEEFDVRFNSKTDGPTEWLVDGLSAAKLRRENAKAWLCTSSTADENGWANRVYFLQQKDGTLYLVMAAEQPENQNRNFVCWVFRLTEKPVPTYDSMEAYALSVINALKQPNGYTYYILPDGAQSSADGTPIEVTEAAADVRVTELEKLGDCADLAPDGTLELWSFSYEVKPEDKAGALPDRFFWVGGNNITDDGYISDGFYYYLTVLRTDGEPGVYRLLDSRMANDGLWYNGCGYENTYEYLYDFYADYAGLDVPRYMITDFLNADDLIRENVVTSSDDCTARRYNGNGWYLYIPTVAWTKTIGQDSWYSAYCDGSTLCVDKSYDSVEMMETFYRDNGFTLEQYREGAALSGPWLRYDAESGTQFANYLAPDPDYGGCYIISAYWNPTDDTSVNEWGYSTRNRILNEAVKLRAMAQSFTVAPGLERQYEAPAEESASQPTEPEVTVEPATAEKTPEELRADILKTADRTLEQGGYLWYIADGALSRCDANGGVEQLYKLPSSELSPVLIEKLNVSDDMVLLAYRVGGGFMGSTKQCLFNSKTGGVAYELADCADFLIDGDTVVKTDSFAAPTTGNLSISHDRGKTWEKLGDPSYIYDRPVTLQEDGSMSADATSNTSRLEGGYLYTTGAYWGEGSAQPDAAVPVRVDLATGETAVLNDGTAPTDESQTAA
ncbi:MAG: M56 family metallopeptidase [Oscillospiraceae bacterium]|nr:M56 family metallopeptidase [Oscillospiraceae bacterium]